MIFEAISDPAVMREGNWWLNMVGFGKGGESENSGLGALLAAAGIAIGFILTKSDTVLFIPIAVALGLLAADFIQIFNILRLSSPVLATLVMTPIIISYVFIVVEFARGKD
ncbi:unnamed protein product [marine sediment metagenome]|uniref:Uncharacterized protein n=1 Tax=marine sediment metagenome TaxID=412755 RepID=X1A918_9ZZZZ